MEIIRTKYKKQFKLIKYNPEELNDINGFLKKGKKFNTHNISSKDVRINITFSFSFVRTQCS